MTPIQRWHRKLELKLDKVLNGHELAAILGVSHSHFTKVYCGQSPLTGPMKITMKKVLAPATKLL